MPVGKIVCQADVFCLTAQAGFAIRQSSLSGNNSVVECDLAKVEVAGSNPVSRSIQLNRIIYDSGNIAPTFTKAFTKRAVMRVGAFHL